MSVIEFNNVSQRLINLSNQTDDILEEFELMGENITDLDGDAITADNARIRLNELMIQAQGQWPPHITLTELSEKILGINLELREAIENGFNALRERGINQAEFWGIDNNIGLINLYSAPQFNRPIRAPQMQTQHTWGPSLTDPDVDTLITDVEFVMHDWTLPPRNTPTEWLNFLAGGHGWRYDTDPPDNAKITIPATTHLRNRAQLDRDFNILNDWQRVDPNTERIYRGDPVGLMLAYSSVLMALHWYINL